MPYPLPPWHLHGTSLQTLHLLDIDRVRSLIPAELNIVSVLPGKTLGGLYLASYQADSTLKYNELIVVSGLIAAAGKIGAWISHIYVDLPDSVAGGREIWGLPKQLAQFSWSFGTGVTVQVQDGDRLLCTMKTQWQLPGWQQGFQIPIFSLLRSQLIWFEGQASAKLNWTGIDLQIPPDSLLTALHMGHPWLGFYSDSTHLTANSPVLLASR